MGFGKARDEVCTAEPPASVRIDASHGEVGKLMTPESPRPRHHSLLLRRVARTLRMRVQKREGMRRAASLLHRAGVLTFLLPSITLLHPRRGSLESLTLMKVSELEVSAGGVREGGGGQPSRDRRELCSVRRGKSARSPASSSERAMGGGEFNEQRGDERG
ncbi:hypothetical protein BCR35DRAFT_173375 [Leucosporidium creatinivorum]|uniref:Uncharacterized protein n=1 Tax=Leucosporidium creatinivorum TaxID=106004 RepID=A0A1Y2G0M1_9BASI|nr:hypothetical protein BCR35DRAFT_173375 [Leucosporidium creatinivorum]